LAVVGRLAFVAPSRGRSTPYSESPEAEAKNPGSVGSLGRRGGRESCRVLCLGRSALGRSLNVGSAHAPPRSGAYHTTVSTVDLSPRVQPILGEPVASQSDDAQPLGAQAGPGDGRAAHRRQSSTSRGGTANPGQDRWRAAVCRRVDQDGTGVGAATR